MMWATYQFATYLPPRVPHHLFDTGILSYSRSFLSVSFLSLDFILSFVSLFSPFVNHDSCVMLYQAVPFLFAPPGYGKQLY